MAESHTNGSSESVNRPSSPGRDLPKDLLDAGWRKYFSKREQRPYYFNKFSNQSLWEEPTLGVRNNKLYTTTNLVIKIQNKYLCTDFIS